MKKDKDTEKRTHRKEIQFNDAEWDMICIRSRRLCPEQQAIPNTAYKPYKKEAPLPIKIKESILGARLIRFLKPMVK